jgi:epsilon-lactone hydrolase
VAWLFRTSRVLRAAAKVAAALAALVALAPAQADEPSVIDEDGTIHVPAFTLPESSYLSAETRAVLKQERLERKQHPPFEQVCHPENRYDIKLAAAIRECIAEAYYRTDEYKRLRSMYPVTISHDYIAGVYTEIFTPVSGVAPENARRVLINVHGGGFGGSRWASHNESIPIASVARIRVLSVDYRLPPEGHFPAASQDVAAVYRQLLKTYDAKAVGIYGCSTGGEVTAESIAWILNEHLPPPAAAGLFCYGASRSLRGNNDKWAESDELRILEPILYGTQSEEDIDGKPYFIGINRNNPLVSPGDYDDVMRQFPPTLLISSTRDPLLSSVITTHAQLVRLGVEADLLVWEGMEHGFLFTDPRLPESREAYSVIANFFDRHLSK